MEYQKAIKIILSALVLTFSANANALNFITNGSFESPDLDTNPVGKNLGSGTGWEVFDSIDGWYTPAGQGAGIEIQKSGIVVQAKDGNQYVELDSHGANSNSLMVQEIDGLTVGADYTLSFWYQPRTNNGFNDNGIDVYWGKIGFETLVLSIVNQLAQDYSDWVNYSLELTATDSTMNLGFYAAGNQNTLGGLLDDVSLVPEPATLVLFGFGLLGIVATARRKMQA